MGRMNGLGVDDAGGRACFAHIEREHPFQFLQFQRARVRRRPNGLLQGVDLGSQRLDKVSHGGLIRRQPLFGYLIQWHSKIISWASIWTTRILSRRVRVWPDSISWPLVASIFS